MTTTQYTVALSSSAEQAPGAPIRDEVSYPGYQRVTASFIEKDGELTNEGDITFPTAADPDQRTHVLSTCLLDGDTVVASSWLEFPITVGERVAPQFKAGTARFSVKFS